MTRPKRFILFCAAALLLEKTDGAWVYALGRSPFIIAVAKPAARARAFVEFIFSAVGRRIVSHSGYSLPPTREAR